MSRSTAVAGTVALACVVAVVAVVLVLATSGRSGLQGEAYSAHTQWVTPQGPVQARVRRRISVAADLAKGHVLPAGTARARLLDLLGPPDRDVKRDGTEGMVYFAGITPTPYRRGLWSECLSFLEIQLQAGRVQSVHLPPALCGISAQPYYSLDDAASAR